MTKIEKLIGYFGEYNGFGKYTVIGRFVHDNKQYAVTVHESQIGGGIVVLNDDGLEDEFRVCTSHDKRLDGFMTAHMMPNDIRGHVHGVILKNILENCSHA